MDEINCAMTGLIFTKELLKKIKSNETPKMNELKDGTPTTIEVFKDKVSPARACVEVAALPKGGLVEIDCIAWLGEKQEIS